MKLSVMLFPFQRLVLEDPAKGGNLVRTFHKQGITGLEPMLSNIDSAPEAWAETKAAAADLGMAYACLDIGANLVWEGVDDRTSALDTVKRGLDLAAKIKCPTVLIAGSRPPEGMSNEEGRKRYAQGLAESAELAKGRGLDVTIEDFGVYPEFACRSDHVLEVVRGTGRNDVHITYDNGNFILADEEPMHALAAVRDLTTHVHIKDFVADASGKASLKTPSGVAFLGAEIGEGDCQVAECLASLKRSGYADWVSIEVSTSPPTEAAVRAAEMMRKAWEGA